MVNSATLLGLLASVAPPEVVDAVVGVAPTLVANLESELGIAFPRAYRAFLEAMGEHTGGFSAAEHSHATRMSELLAVLPGPDARTRRYWRISIERQLMQQMPVDYHLDLSTSNGVDAEVVAFTFPPESDDDEGDRIGLTFYELFRLRMFEEYVVAGASAAVSLHVLDRSAEHRWELRQILVDVLGAQGFEVFAPHAGRLDLFRREDASVRAREFEQTQGLGVFITTTTPEIAVLVLETIRDRFPDDAGVEWPRP